MTNLSAVRRIAIMLAALSITACNGTIDSPVADQATGVRPLLPGMTAPAFSARDADGETWELSPPGLERPVVLAFYRGGWCPHCSRYLAGMRPAGEALRDMGYDIVFLSADRWEVLSEYRDDRPTGYRLLSDSNMAIAQQYGVAFRLDDETWSKYLGAGHDLAAAAGEAHRILPVPSVFIIGRDGRIHFQYANPDYKVRLHPDVLLAAARVALDAD